MDPSAQKRLRMLHLEDNPFDAKLVHRKLRIEEPGCEIVWVKGRAEFEAALSDGRFDIILCDFNLADYDGLAALELARERQPDAPVLMMTGAMSEDEAVQCVKAGASDYILKDRLQRLQPALTRALREAAEHRVCVRTEAALRLSEERLELALEAAEVSIWECDIASGQVAFSRQFGPLLGYAAGEVPAQIDAWEALAHPADVKRLRVALARHYRGEAPAIDIEYRVRGRGGQWRWIHSTGRAVARDAEGRVTRMSGAHRDITDERRTDEMLLLRQRALDAAANAIVIVDARAADYPIVHVNPAFERMTGYSTREALGRNCRFLQGRDRGQPELERLRDAIASGAEAAVLLRNYRKDGSLFWNNLRVSPVHNRAGKVTHFVGIQNDVTELRRREEELRAHRAREHEPAL